MQGLLRHIFIMQRMPAEVSDGDRTLIVAAALVRRNGVVCWKLTQKGEDLFLDLHPE